MSQALNTQIQEAAELALEEAGEHTEHPLAVYDLAIAGLKGSRRYDPDRAAIYQGAIEALERARTFTTRVTV